MKFSILSVITLLGATASAAVFNHPSSEFEVKIRRQTRPDVSVAVMTDSDGNVIPYDRDVLAKNKKIKAKRAAALGHKSG